MPDTQPRQITISAYLIKENRAKPRPVIADPRHLKQKRVTLRNGTRCELYVRPMAARPPKWANLLHAYADSSAGCRGQVLDLAI